LIIEKAVILAGGSGSRAKTRVYSNAVSKVMLRINNKPILQRNIEIIRDLLKIKSILIIVSKNDCQIKNYFDDGKKLGINIEYIESDPSYGIADALYLCKGKITGSFLLMLGDEFYLNTDHETLLEHNYDDVDAIITFINTANPQDIANNYSIQLKNHSRVLSLTEKPVTFENDLLGLGTFILKDSIFEYIEKAQKSTRTKRKELIDVISNMAKERIVYVHKLNGMYVNINTIDDWHHATYLFNQINFDAYKKSLVIPAYNEVDSISFVINDFKDTVDEIIIADGGSTDGTIEKILVFNDKCNIKLIQGSFFGYGDAIRKGMEHVTGDIVILIEGDATFRSRDIYKMYEYIKDCDMVIGTRTTKELISQGANMSSGLRFANLLVAKFIELLWIRIEPRITDVGCTYRAFWKNEYDEIKHNFIGLGPEFSPEMIIEFLRNDKRVIEIPVSYYSRIGGASKHSENLSAIIRTGLRMLSLILKKRFSSPLI
jgi:dTDP-glucose pyrophosphorylase